MEGWSRRRKVVTVCVGAFALWLVVVAWLAFDARRSMVAGVAELRQVRRQASVTALLEPERRADLAAAQRDFDRAQHRLDSPVLWPARVLPVASRHLRAADKLVSSAQAGTTAADDALAALAELTERPHAEGPERVALVRDLATVADQAETALAAVDPGSPDALIGPLGDAVAEMNDARDQAQRAAGRLEATADTLSDILDGPTPYLLLGANNAEMRNGSGMFLSAAPLSFDHGSIEMGDVEPTAQLVLPAGSVAVDGDLARNWPWLDPGRDLRNLGLTADFPQSAAVAVDNWAANPRGGEVGGVIVIDVDGIRSLLRAVGPVEVDGVRYTPDTVRGELLRKQYQRYDGDREARRDQLGDVARVIFERLEEGDWELAELSTQLAEAVGGRHLMVWSTDAADRAALREIGADGHLSPTSVSAALMNRGSNKLDSWIETDATMATGPVKGDRRTVHVTYDVANTSPGTGPAYVVGPNIDGVAAGGHRALVVVNLPGGTTDVKMAGARPVLVGGDGPTVVAVGEVFVGAGERTRVTVTGVLPAGLDRVVVEPAARVPRTRWEVDGQAVAGDRRQTVTLEDG